MENEKDLGPNIEDKRPASEAAKRRQNAAKKNVEDNVQETAEKSGF